MALVGRITSSIAHSVRNPLMIIGGFARSMLKNSSESDPGRTFIESIVQKPSNWKGCWMKYSIIPIHCIPPAISGM